MGSTKWVCLALALALTSSACASSETSTASEPSIGSETSAESETSVRQELIEDKHSEDGDETPPVTIQTMIVLPNGEVAEKTPPMDPADAPWDTPTGIVSALVVPISISEPPGALVESVSVTVSTGENIDRIEVVARAAGDFLYDDLSFLVHQFPMFPRDLAAIPLPEGENIRQWEKDMSGSYNPDAPDVGATVKATLSTTGTLGSSAAEAVRNLRTIPTATLARPIRQLMEAFPPVAVDIWQLTWRPAEPHTISAALWLTSAPENQHELAKWLGARAIPEASFVQGTRLRTTLAGEPAIDISWAPDWREDQVWINFDYLLDDNGAPVETPKLSALPAHTNLISWGEEWLFDDDGSVDLGWNAVDFSPVDWSLGLAPFHRQESPKVFPTLVDTPEEGMTSWYRHTFDSADPSSIERLHIETLVDDGLVVWLNGIELYRWNMPDGPVASDTRSVERVSGHEELIVRRGIDLPREALVAGENLVAVEVHQATTDSSDIRFDLHLTAS